MRFPLAVLVLVSILSTSCGSDEPAAGDPCELHDRTCTSSSAMLVCDGGVLESRACSGPEGCRGDLVVFCDEGARAGAACSSSGAAQCSFDDSNKAFRCTDGKWAAERCNLCEPNGTTAVRCQ